MVEVARDDVGAAAQHRGQRLRAALEADEFDVEAGLVVFAELLGQHGGQVAEAAGAADRDAHLHLALRQRQAGQQRQDGAASTRRRNGFATMTISSGCLGQFLLDGLISSSTAQCVAAEVGRQTKSRRSASVTR